VIAAKDLEVRAGPRLLLKSATLHVGEGDRIGLVGRNGAGKTTLIRILAGEAQAAGGAVTAKGGVAYLPQDPRTSGAGTGLGRILEPRGLDSIAGKMREAEEGMASPDVTVRDAALDRYPRLEERFRQAGGYAAESEALRIASNLGLAEEALRRPLETLSGGQRRRVELARVLFSGAQTLLLDEPTNHLDAGSVAWLQEFLRSFSGGFIVVSHDAELLRVSVNKVFHLDADRAEVDQYSLGWDAYLKQREEDERRRHRERDNAERKAEALVAQANRMRAKATKAVAAQVMLKRAERLVGGLEAETRRGRVAALRFPTPEPCGKTPLRASRLSKSYGSTEVFTDVDIVVDRGAKVVVLGLNGAGKTTLLTILAGIGTPDTGTVDPGHGLRLGYYAQEHETLDPDATAFESLRAAAPELPDSEVRAVLGSFLFSGDDVSKPVGVLSGGEKTRLALATLVASGANVLLLDEPTNNLDPSSRDEILKALSSYEGAVVLVTHDEGAVDALGPERVLLLPDGVEDYWSEQYRDLVALT